MDNITSQESFMTWVINFFAEKFPNHAILKGGMVLRIMGCPRSTNDIDYVFVPFQSKKDILPLIEKEIEQIPQIEMTHTFHSTNLRLMLMLTNNNGQFQTQVEISANESIKSDIASTSDYAINNNNNPHVIQIVSFDVALANKMAAWNERELMRDLYDIYFIYDSLKILPDICVLEQRLLKINYTKNVKKKKLSKSMSIKDFLQRLKSFVENISQNSIEKELSPLFDQRYITGLDNKMKFTLNLLIHELEPLLKP